MVSAQDEAGLATGWVSSATGVGIGISRRRGLLWVLLLLLLLFVLHVLRRLRSCNKGKRTFIQSKQVRPCDARCLTELKLRITVCRNGCVTTTVCQYWLTSASEFWISSRQILAYWINASHTHKKWMQVVYSTTCRGESGATCCVNNIVCAFPLQH